MQAAKEKISKVTMADVARFALVSSSTVSMALRNSPQIAVETRQKVWRATERLGYSTNQRTSGAQPIQQFHPKPQTRNFGFVLVDADFTHRIYAPIFHATLLEATREGQHVFCYPMRSANQEMDNLMHLESSKCDGFLLMGAVLEEHYELLEKIKKPIVILGDHHVSRPVNQVTCNDFQAGRDAVRHLASMGHRRIAFASDCIGLIHRQEWLRGYLEEMKARNIPVQDGFIQAPVQRIPHLEVIKPLFRLSSPPTAIITTSHGEGRSILEHCRKIHVRVPEDLSLLTFSVRHPFSEDDPLSRMEIPTEDIGRIGVKRLRELIADPHETPLTTLIHTSCHDTGSCVPPSAHLHSSGKRKEHS